MKEQSGKLQSLLAITLFSAVAITACRDDRDHVAKVDDFATWVHGHQDPEATNKLLVITVPENESRDPSAFPDITCLRVGLSGDISCVQTDMMGSRPGPGGGFGLSSSRLDKLKALVAKMPAGMNTLPPLNRRILLQANLPSGMRTEVFDRGNIPTEVVEIVRLASAFRSWQPGFGPQGAIATGNNEQEGITCLTPDGKTLVCSGEKALRLIDPASHRVMGETTIGLGSAMEFSPNGSKAIIGERSVHIVDAHNWTVLRRLPVRKVHDPIYTLMHAHFTGDGKYILAECIETGGLFVYDAATLERVDPPDWIPTDAREYVPAPKGSRAIVRTGEGGIQLWDAGRRAVIRELDKPCDLDKAVFSPGGSMVVTVTRDKSGEEPRPRIRLWNAGSGELLHELFPQEQRQTQQVLGVAWPAGEKYLLAAIRPRDFGSTMIGVWNITTGRYRGEFTGCPQYIHGIAITPDGGQLFAGCSDGKLRYWDLAAGLRGVEAFEKEIAP